MTTPLPLDASRVPCRSAPDRWFGDNGDNAMTRVAKQVCAGCPLKKPCAEYGIRHEVHGVWGGLTSAERKRIRKKRGIVVDTPTMGVAYPSRPGPPRTTPEHGSEAGYQRHKRRGEKACQACREGQARARQDRVKRQAAS